MVSVRWTALILVVAIAVTACSSDSSEGEGIVRAKDHVIPAVPQQELRVRHRVLRQPLLQLR